jgi:hypothetical protein
VNQNKFLSQAWERDFEISFPSPNLREGVGGCFLGQVFLIRQIFGILKPKPLSENLKLRSIIENILNYLSKA